jgi:hypothetical protein
MESITSDHFGLLEISYILPEHEDVLPPQEEYNEGAESRNILYDDKLFKHVDNEGNGLCFFYSFAHFITDLYPQQTSSTPKEFVPFINLKNSKSFHESKAAVSLTEFLCTFSEADFDALMELYSDRFSDDNDRKPTKLPTKYALLVDNLRNSVLVKTKKNKRKVLSI